MIMPDDDLSKWQLDYWIETPGDGYPNQQVKVSRAYEWDSGGPTIEIFMQDGSKMSVLVSLDDAENFATLILYEVKRAKGEL